MSRKERIVLDPAELATAGRAELDLHSGPIQVREEGVDWGQAEVEAFMAQHELGESPVDYRLPNRVIAIPLVLGAEGDYDAARIALQAKVARINEEGGWLKRELIGGSYGEAGSHLFCDLVKATLKYGGSTFAARNGVDPDAELVLEALPDFYGDRVDERIFEGTGDVAATFQVKGNLPGRIDLTAYEESGKDQRGLAWGFRCRNYSAASTARLTYNAEALKPLDQASVVALTGAYGGKAIGHTNLSTEWTPVLENTMSGAYPTHVGLYDVWARVYSSAAYPPWVRFVYDVGDLVDPTENDPVRVPGSNNFYLLNLGQVNLREAPIGPHRWIGVVQGRGTGSSLFSLSGYIENLYVDRLWYLPVEEGSGILRAASSFQVGSTLLGGDDFNQTEAKALGGQLAESGGTWQKKGLSVTDFETTGAQKLRRTAVSDTETGLKAPSALDVLSGLFFQKAQAVSVEFESTYLGGSQFGVVARYLNNNNYLLAQYASGMLDDYFWVTKTVEGVSTTIAATLANTFRANQTIEIALSVSEAGVFRAVAASAGTSIFVEGSDPQLDSSKVTGLPYGTVGLFDRYGESWPATRTFRNFVAWEPVDDAVLFANREARLTSDGHFRSPDGVVFGPVASSSGGMPRLPVSGAEERPVELFLKPSRGDFAQVPDSGIDRAMGQLSYRPCWSYVPEEA